MLVVPHKGSASVNDEDDRNLWSLFMTMVIAVYMSFEIEFPLPSGPGRLIFRVSFTIKLP